MKPGITRKELEDVVGIGEVALFYLRETLRTLDSIKKWGIADILLGGWVEGSYKVIKIEEGSKLLQKANSNLLLFQNKLEEIGFNTEMEFDTNLKIDINEFWLLVDDFYDGFITNFIVQGKIKKAIKLVEKTYEKVERVINALRQQYTYWTIGRKRL